MLDRTATIRHSCSRLIYGQKYIFRATFEDDKSTWLWHDRGLVCDRLKWVKCKLKMFASSATGVITMPSIPHVNSLITNLVGVDVDDHWRWQINKIVQCIRHGVCRNKFPIRLILRKRNVISRWRQQQQQRDWLFSSIFCCCVSARSF